MSTVAIDNETRGSKVVRVFYVLLSYFLGVWMLLYGMSKILGLQFQVFPSAYAKPLAQLGGFFAIAAFFGRFYWLQVLLGIVEAVPSILLLFRRTRSIGAVLLLGPISFIAIMDYAYLSPSDSGGVLAAVTTMLLTDVILILMNRNTRKWIRQMFLLDARLNYRRVTLEVAINSILVLVVAGFTYQLGQSLESDRGAILGFPQINGRGAWDVKEFEIDQKAIDVSQGEKYAQIYFNFDGSCEVNNAPTELKRKCIADIDARQHTMKLTGLPLGGLNAPVEATYKIDGASLSLVGHAGSHSISLSLDRHGW